MIVDSGSSTPVGVALGGGWNVVIVDSGSSAVGGSPIGASMVLTSPKSPASMAEPTALYPSAPSLGSSQLSSPAANRSINQALSPDRARSFNSATRSPNGVESIVIACHKPLSTCIHQEGEKSWTDAYPRSAHLNVSAIILHRGCTDEADHKKWQSELLIDQNGHSNDQWLWGRKRICLSRISRS